MRRQPPNGIQWREICLKYKLGVPVCYPSFHVLYDFLSLWDLKTETLLHDPSLNGEGATFTPIGFTYDDTEEVILFFATTHDLPLTGR